jgi:hypothetical protein
MAPDLVNVLLNPSFGRNTQREKTPEPSVVPTRVRSIFRVFLVVPLVENLANMPSYYVKW